MKCKLREIMKARGITQRELAKNTGLSESLICYLAQNKRACTVRVAAVLMRALDCSFDELWEV